MAESANSLSDEHNINLDENYNPPRLENHVEEIEEIKDPESFVAATDSLVNICNTACSNQNISISHNIKEMPVISQEVSNDEFSVLSENVNINEIESGIVADVTGWLINVTNSVSSEHSVSLDNNQSEVSGNPQESLSNEFELISHGTNGAPISEQNTNGDHDTESKLRDLKSDKLIDLTNTDINLSNDGFGEMFSEFNKDNAPVLKDEEFHDAVQFFKDPSSLAFLENVGTATATAESMITRSSLYVSFDPLHKKFFNQPTSKSNDLQLINESETEAESITGNVEDNEPKTVNKLLSDISQRESLGNILISFDSPMNIKTTDSNLTEKPSVPKKIYTEEELQQALKVQELCLQELLLKKQQEFEAKLNKQNEVSIAFHGILKEFVSVCTEFFQKNCELQQKNENLELEIKKHEVELKTSTDDLQSVENAFSDFHKRYEQCKSMLKIYKDNEDNLKQQIENLQTKCQEQDQMYALLHSRTEEMLEKANAEVVNAKKCNETQVAVLKAQLKKAELRISSLESDIKNVKLENSKLGGICDDLMAKVGEA